VFRYRYRHVIWRFTDFVPRLISSTISRLYYTYVTAPLLGFDPDQFPRISLWVRLVMSIARVAVVSEQQEVTALGWRVPVGWQFWKSAGTSAHTLSSIGAMPESGHGPRRNSGRSTSRIVNS
jgi:hypothetical protein